MAHGTAVDYREDGSKWRETVFVKHNKQSEVWYREDGSKWKEMPYNGFVLHGTVVWLLQGRIEEGRKSGSRQGTWHSLGYREDGSKAMETVYENGNKISRKDL